MNITIDNITKAFALCDRLRETAEKAQALWEKAKREEEKAYILAHNSEPAGPPPKEEIIRLRIAVTLAATKQALVDLRLKKANDYYERLVKLYSLNELKLSPEEHDAMMKSLMTGSEFRYQGVGGYVETPAYQGIGEDGEPTFGEIPIGDANSLSPLDISTELP